MSREKKDYKKNVEHFKTILENQRLEKENAELKKLLSLAMEEMKPYCKNCVDPEIGCCCKCTANKWQHAAEVEGVLSDES